MFSSLTQGDLLQGVGVALVKLLILNRVYLMQKIHNFIKIIKQCLKGVMLVIIRIIMLDLAAPLLGLGN